MSYFNTETINQSFHHFIHKAEVKIRLVKLYWNNQFLDTFWTFQWFFFDQTCTILSILIIMWEGEQTYESELWNTAGLSWKVPRPEEEKGLSGLLPVWLCGEDDDDAPNREPIPLLKPLIWDELLHIILLLDHNGVSFNKRTSTTVYRHVAYFNNSCDIISSINRNVDIPIMKFAWLYWIKGQSALY